ncbi:MAG TPA: nuclear transport factor 2 family protein [Polyangiaceae bacterium]
MGNRATVTAIYEAFGRGDIALIMSQLRDDIDWEYDTVDRWIPWFVPGRGLANVQHFFDVAMAKLEARGFQLHDLLESEHSVAAIVSVHWLVRETGRELRDHEGHLWSFDAEGRASRLKHFCDTAAHLTALGRR